MHLIISPDQQHALSDCAGMELNNETISDFGYKVSELRDELFDEVVDTNLDNLLNRLSPHVTVNDLDRPDETRQRLRPFVMAAMKGYYEGLKAVIISGGLLYGRL